MLFLKDESLAIEPLKVQILEFKKLKHAFLQNANMNIPTKLQVFSSIISWVKNICSGQNIKKPGSLVFSYFTKQHIKVIDAHLHNCLV